MNMLMDLITNRIFVATAAAWLVAQVLKVIIDAAKNGFSAEPSHGKRPVCQVHIQPQLRVWSFRLLSWRDWEDFLLLWLCFLLLS